LQSDTAAASMTASSLVITSWYETVGRNSASGSFTGSAVYTPWTLVALMTTSDSISIARSTAAVSVEK